MSATRSSLGAFALAALLVSCDLGPSVPSPDAGHACGDGVDNDRDGRADFPYDPGCESELDPGEDDPKVARLCGNGLDDDNDGKTDFDTNGNGAVDGSDDPGCDSAADDDESNAVLPACADGSDNDGDGQTDFPSDPQCSSRNDMSEAQ